MEKENVFVLLLICSRRQVTTRELSPAINVLQLFLSSPKATLRFAAVRTLNKVNGV
jgi:coatomer protein complex subunit gamma